MQTSLQSAKSPHVKTDNCITQQARCSAVTLLNGGLFLCPARVAKLYLKYIQKFWGGTKRMEFFNSAIGVLQTLVIALGAGLGVWGIVNLLEGYGNDNPGAKSQGMKQLMAGGGIALLGMLLIPQLTGLFG